VDAVWAALGLLAVLHVAYATWTAKRLDRLHRRVDAARGALDRQLRLRAEAASALGRSPQLRDAAANALTCGELDHDREAAESALSRALDGVGDIDPTLADLAVRAAIARRFHNDTVRDALVVRQRRIVRWFRLAGSARMPTFFEMDDGVLDRRTIEV
jgi:hypothetical protein